MLPGTDRYRSNRRNDEAGLGHVWVIYRASSIHPIEVVTYLARGVGGWGYKQHLLVRLTPGQV